jgi:L-fuconolactonase
VRSMTIPPAPSRTPTHATVKRLHVGSLLMLMCGLLSAVTATAEELNDIPIIDCHVHVWDISRSDGVSWIRPDDKILYRSILPAYHQPFAEAVGIKAAVVVQAGQSLPDNQWNLDITAHAPSFYRGIVGNLSRVIGTDEFAPLFEKLCQDDRYVGFRLSGRYQEQLTDAFFRDLQLTHARGRCVDVLAGSYSLADVDQIAQRLPELRIMVNHCGNLRLDDKPLDPTWVASLRAVARNPTVYCKVSALFGRVKPQPAPRDVEFYRPILDLVYESFGEDRLVFGSDWPVSESTGDYAAVLALVRAYFAAKGRPVLEKLLHRNAAHFYRLADVAATP